MKPFLLPLLAIFCIGSLFGCAAQRAKHGEHVYKDFDRNFLTWMLRHQLHDMTVLSACERKRVRPQLASFCADALRDQTLEADKMKNMLKNWYGKEAVGEDHSLWIESQQGEVFERYFLRSLAEGHDAAAAEAEECTAKAQREELRLLCSELKIHRAEESKKLKQWNCEWFKEC